MKRRYLGMAFIVGYVLMLIVMVTMCCCTNNDDVARITGESTIASTDGGGTMSTQAVKDVKIVYFDVKKTLDNNASLPMRSVKLIWQIKHADEARTRLDDHWVQPCGYAWVQVQAGVETPFRLVAHGVNGSLDIRLIQVLAR